MLGRRGATTTSPSTCADRPVARRGEGPRARSCAPCAPRAPRGSRRRSDERSQPAPPRGRSRPGSRREGCAGPSVSRSSAPRWAPVSTTGVSESQQPVDQVDGLLHRVGAVRDDDARSTSGVRRARPRAGRARARARRACRSSGTRTKSSSSSGGASGQASISTSSSPLTAGTSLPVSGSGRIAIVPPVETTTTVTRPAAYLFGRARRPARRRGCRRPPRRTPPRPAAPVRRGGAGGA